MTIRPPLDDPVAMARVHTVFTVAWFLMVPVAIYTGWIGVVAFVSVISITAMAASHWAAREAATAQRDLKAQLDRIEASLRRLEARPAVAP